jgi:hypothetical protein
MFFDASLYLSIFPLFWFWDLFLVLVLSMADPTTGGGVVDSDDDMTGNGPTDVRGFWYM